MHLLNPDVPLNGPPTERREIVVEQGVLARYVGHIMGLPPNFVLSITLDRDQLFAQATGQIRAPIFAETDCTFFFRVIGAQISFHLDSKGRCHSLTLHQNGMAMPGKHI